jgi:hypothetical protein
MRIFEKQNKILLHVVLFYKNEIAGKGTPLSPEKQEELNNLFEEPREKGNKEHRLSVLKTEWLNIAILKELFPQIFNSKSKEWILTSNSLYSMVFIWWSSRIWYWQKTSFRVCNPVVASKLFSCHSSRIKMERVNLI